MIAVYASIAALSFAWFAGDAVLGLIVAPELFGLARQQGVDTAFAGLVFGELLASWVVCAGLLGVTPIAVLLGIVAGRRLKQHGLKAAVVPLIAIAIVVAAHTTTATITAIGRDTAQELRERPDAERMERFRGEFHARSRLVMGFEMLTAVALAIGAILAAHRHRKAGRVQDAALAAA